MKTNLSIELNDDQRLDLGRRYNNTTNKKLLTRTELNDIVQNFVLALLDTNDSIVEVTQDTAKGTWNKIYYYNGKKISKAEWDLVPEGPRKFYGFPDFNNT